MASNNSPMNPRAPEDFEGWYIVLAHGRHESEVRDDLVEKGLEVYLPLQRHLVRHARKTDTVERALIPRHLFAYVKVKGDFYAISSHRHVTGLMRNAQDRYVRIEEEALAFIHFCEETGAFDATPAARPELAFGEPIRITAGQFEGRTATFTKLKGGDRAMILLDAIIKGGMRCVADVEAALIEPLAA